jgi:hypothetical protein
MLLTRYYSGHEIKKNETVGASGTYVGEERCVQLFLIGEPEEKNTWKTLA